MRQGHYTPAQAQRAPKARLVWMGGWTDIKSLLIFFLILRHIRHYPHILLKYILNVCLYEFRMGFKFWLSWGLDAKIQNYPLEWIFFSLP